MLEFVHFRVLELAHSAEFSAVVLQADGPTTTLVDSVFVFLVSLLVGTLAIHAGALVMVDSDTGWGKAAVAALVGAAVWVLVGVFLGWIPFLGPVLMLIAWVGVINAVYPRGWITAAGIGLVAWIVAVAILYLLTTVGIVGPDALGVPT